MNYDINKLTKVLEKHADYLQTGDASKRANLRGANLIGADLIDAYLIGADLIEDTNLTSANLSGAWLNGVTLPKYYYLPVNDNG